MAEAVAQKKDILTGRSVVEFKNKFYIYPDAPLADLNRKDALAFHASFMNNSGDDLFALVYHPEAPPRTDVLDAMKSMGDLHMFSLQDWGLVNWPQPMSRRICAIYQKNYGQPIFKDMNGVFETFSEDDLINGFIIPCYNIFEAFSLRGVTYRSLRTTNLYMTDKGRKHVILGDCTSYYPAMAQPVLFETIESGLTTPCARGEGTIVDDLYCLGAVLAVLTLGYHPFNNEPDDYIIEQKLMSGSFGAIVGNSKISVSLLEPIRGLLIDDPYDRWSLKDLKSWIDGRRLNPRQPIVPKRATRPFAFEDREYYHLDTLLIGLMKNSSKGVSVLKNNVFHHWLKRSLGNENLSLEIEALYDNLIKSGVSATPEKMTSRLLMSINHVLPVFFKGLSFQIKGFGHALAFYFDKTEIRQIVAEAIASRLPVHWIGSQKKSLPHITKMLDVYEKMPRILGSADLGLGMERLFYDLNPSFPCMSPLVKDFAVLTLEDILPMLELVAPNAQGKTEPYDRHILAFIGSRGRVIGEGMVNTFRRDLTSLNPALSLLRLYAQLQGAMRKKHLDVKCPNLAKWILSFSPQGVVRYQSLERQKVIEKKLAENSSQGDLIALLELADDLRMILQDKHEFNDARRYYHEISSFHLLLQEEHENIDKVSALIGARVAAMICTGLSVLATLIILFNFL